MDIMSTVSGFTSGPTSSGMLTWHAATLSCGHNWHDRQHPWSPVESVKVGDSVVCERCTTNAAEEQWLRDLDYSQVHHSRFDPRFGGLYRFYRLDHTSPSNFMIIGGVAATPAIDAILRTKTNCGPLSPTEPA